MPRRRKQLINRIFLLFFSFVFINQFLDYMSLIVSCSWIKMWHSIRMRIKKSNSCHCVWLKTGGNEQLDPTFSCLLLDIYQEKNINESTNLNQLQQLSVVLYFNYPVSYIRLWNNTPIFFSWWFGGKREKVKQKEITSIV